MKKEDLQIIINNKNRYKKLVDHLPTGKKRTPIKDICINKNKDGYEVFYVIGKDFQRSFVLEYGEIYRQTEDRIIFKVQMWNNFSIRK